MKVGFERSKFTVQAGLTACQGDGPSGFKAKSLAVVQGHVKSSQVTQREQEN